MANETRAVIAAAGALAVLAGIALATEARAMFNSQVAAVCEDNGTLIKSLRQSVDRIDSKLFRIESKQNELRQTKVAACRAYALRYRQSADPADRIGWVNIAIKTGCWHGTQ